MSAESENTPHISRREFLRKGLHSAALLASGTLAAGMLHESSSSRTVWQIDPYICIHCGNCADNCVLSPSAVKCVHSFLVCGYCELCFGFYRPGVSSMEEGAENQLCPTNAITRRFVEEPYFQYTIDDDLCIGCAKCVEGCTTFGNGSLFLQIRHDRCLNCNECSIAASCPSGAVKRVPAETPYLLKDNYAGPEENAR